MELFLLSWSATGVNAAALGAVLASSTLVAIVPPAARLAVAGLSPLVAILLIVLIAIDVVPVLPALVAVVVATSAAASALAFSGRFHPLLSAGVTMAAVAFVVKLTEQSLVALSLLPVAVAVVWGGRRVAAYAIAAAPAIGLLVGLLLGLGG